MFVYIHQKESGCLAHMLFSSRLGQSKLQEVGRGPNPPNNFHLKIGTFSILYVAALVMTALQCLGSTARDHRFPQRK